MSFQINIDMEKCTGCGSCYDVCAFDVYGEATGGKAVLVNVDDCSGCRSCEAQCPENAIEVIEL